jgi:hypothetical protein
MKYRIMGKGANLIVHADEIDIVFENRISPPFQLIFYVRQEHLVQLHAFEIRDGSGQGKVF